MTDATPLLAVDDLRMHFPLAGHSLFGPGRLVKAVDGVSLSLNAGETLGIVGESGCGKSTLARGILRLVEPSSGRVTWDGIDFLKLSKSELRARRKEMQIIFQDPLASLDPMMTVRRILERPLASFMPGLSSAERRARIVDAMTAVGLSPGWMNRYPHEFSGGQAQRIGIARAMILRPRLIICDEPVSALDVSIQAQIINLLMELQRDLGLSMIFISHNLSVVRHISHRVMVLYLGQVMEIASRDTIYRRPLHPYTQALISAVPIPDPKLERTRMRVRVGGDLPSALNPPSGCVFRTRCPRATDRCASETPVLRSFGDGHQAACHYAEAPPGGV